MTAQCIVIAWIRRSREIGYTKTQPIAAVWVCPGDEDDVATAKAFVAKSNQEPIDPGDSPFYIFTYPKDDPDPLGRARRDVMEAVRGGERELVWCRE